MGVRLAGAVTELPVQVHCLLQVSVRVLAGALDGAGGAQIAVDVGLAGQVGGGLGGGQ